MAHYYQWRSAGFRAAAEQHPLVEAKKPRVPLGDPNQNPLPDDKGRKRGATKPDFSSSCKVPKRCSAAVVGPVSAAERLTASAGTSQGVVHS